ncbi:uncharacterized protein OCT59_029820 [Rhizophagus irregularis]|uniref:uncharacterized protein n=1 Tax=Rhizophagus irregularis TaxID=588596 RepID=UPI0033208E4D|nr:hypothetical protein OCT59_029820 [Rhizophagus irregularis]
MILLNSPLSTDILNILRKRINYNEFENNIPNIIVFDELSSSKSSFLRRLSVLPNYRYSKRNFADCLEKIVSINSYDYSKVVDFSNWTYENKLILIKILRLMIVNLRTHYLASEMKEFQKSYVEILELTTKLLRDIHSLSETNKDIRYYLSKRTKILNTKVAQNDIYSYYSGKCGKCGKKYADMTNKWCKSCQINHLKNNFTNWTSKNEKIVSFNKFN